MIRKTDFPLNLVIFAFLSVAILTSCSSKKEKKTPPQPQHYDLTGTWDFTAYKNEKGEWQEMAILAYSVSFKEDGTYSTNYLGVNLSGSYKYKEEDKIEANTEIGTIIYVIYSLDDNQVEVELYTNDNAADKARIRLGKHVGY